MKPLGLEGKVGAPAIVRGNPFDGMRDRFIEAFSPFYTAGVDPQESRISRFFERVGTFAWQDALSFVQSRYDAGDALWLDHFIWEASGRVPDPVLVYDLDTPCLCVTCKSVDDRSRVLILRGSCESAFVSGCGIIGEDLVGIFGQIRGDDLATKWSVTGWYALKRDSRPTIYLAGDSYFALSPPSGPAGKVPSISEIDCPVTVQDAHPVLVLSDVPLVHGPFATVCAPRYTEVFASITGRMREAANDPISFAKESVRLRSDLQAERRRCDDVADLISGDSDMQLFDPAVRWQYHQGGSR